MFDETKSRVVDIVLRISLVIFLLILYGLDIAILEQVSNSISIAKTNFDSYLSFSGIRISIIILGALQCLAHICFCISAIDNESIIDKPFLYIITLVNMLIEIPREAILYRFIGCFNYSSHAIIKARFSFTFVWILILLGLSIINVLKESSTNRRIVNTINLILVTCISITIIGFNVAFLVNLKSVLSFPVGPNNIDLGFFTESEIDEIEKNDFLKDEFYKTKIVAKLSDVIYSKKTTKAYQVCSYNSDCVSLDQSNCTKTCTDYNWRYHTVSIDCNNQTRNVFLDCFYANKMKILLKYTENGSFPIYSCGTENSKTCSPGCPDLSMDYRLYMVQQNSSKIEKAWRSLCNCLNIYPNLRLNQDSNSNVCLSNANILNFNKFFLYFFNLFSILLFIAF